MTNWASLKAAYPKTQLKSKKVSQTLGESVVIYIYIYLTKNLYTGYIKNSFTSKKKKSNRTNFFLIAKGFEQTLQKIRYTNGL